jgi:NAD(P)H dehydrogenase (quinone)
MFVILGATGKIGGATIGALRRAGAPVRAVMRDQDKAAPFLKTGCDCAIANIGDAAALARAMDGAEAVQVLCPMEPQAVVATDAMRRSIDALAEAIVLSRPKTVLAISDYGAHLSNGAGLTMTFHWLEGALRRAAPNLILVRSAEHMQNWARVLAVAAATGALPSLHQPLTKLFPTVSAFDVGAVCAELLLASKPNDGVRVVHVEGPQRYTTLDVAGAMSAVLGRDVAARELPRSDWEVLLGRGGMSASYARLVADLYDVHNAGRIDVEEGGEIRRGASDLVTAFAPLAPKRDA